MISVGFEVIPFERVAHGASVNEVVEIVRTAMDAWLKVIYGKPGTNLYLTDATVATLEVVCRTDRVSDLQAH